MLAAEGSRESVSETPQTVVSTPEQSVPTERAGLDTDVTPFSIREGYSADAASIPAIITEKEVVSVETGSDADFGNYVKLTFDESGKAAFAEATKRLAGSGTMSVWIGETVMMNPSVGGQIVNGEVLLMCDTKEQADYLAKQIRHAAGLQ
jgi:preprotein translocase subunit SecD